MRFFNDRPYIVPSLNLDTISNGLRAHEFGFSGELGYLPITALTGSNDSNTVRRKRISPSATTSPKIGNFINSIYSSRGISNIYVNPNHDNDRYWFLTRNIQNLKDNLTSYLEHDGNHILMLRPRGTVRGSYENISDAFFKNYTTRLFLQSTGEIFSGNGMLYIPSSNRFLMMIVFRTELLKYHKLHMLMNNEFDYSAMELWIEPGLDTPQFEYSGVRRMFRNIITPNLESISLPVKECGNFEDLKVSIVYPTGVSVSEFQEWKEKFYSYFKEEEHKESMNVTFE